MWRKIKKLPLYEINESTEAAKNMGVSGPPVFSVIKKAQNAKDLTGLQNIIRSNYT